MAHYVHTARLTLIQAIGLFLFVLGLTTDAVLIYLACRVPSNVPSHATGTILTRTGATVYLG